ncbi:MULTISPECIES: hypothetical protein [unclassified Thioalkalivibrio]|uniref:hypothetical protein n=1 Tax=unclassified Thioalkalivibrio TaxID=2621013 RepID=UPI0012DCDE62|nr:MULTISPECIES: hypothetical protein [unclassified Thioalkalivibrio]
MASFPNLGFSSCELAGAVAEAAIHDLRVNRFSFSGFPQIDVSWNEEDMFSVVLSWKGEANVQFQLSKAEAKAAVKKFKDQSGFDRAIFDRVQKALAQLEGRASEARLRTHGAT